MNNEVLELKNVSFSYPQKEVLKNINFTLNEGEILGILGPNGGGKTTLLKLISDQLQASSGEINFRQQELSYVPQESNLNLSFPLQVKDIFSFYAKKFPEELVKLFSLEDSLQLFYDQLSGGQKKRVQIVCALIKRPQLLILDEPTAGLDGSGIDQLLGQLSKYTRESKTAVIVVDHNINEIIEHSDKILCLNKTLHWHEKAELVTKDVLQSIYHCEFEHLLLHHQHQSHLKEEHKLCNEDHRHDDKKEDNK